VRIQKDGHTKKEKIEYNKVLFWSTLRKIEKRK